MANVQSAPAEEPKRVVVYPLQVFIFADRGVMCAKLKEIHDGHVRGPVENLVHTLLNTSNNSRSVFLKN